MGKRIIISEQEKNEIQDLYGLVNEQYRIPTLQEGDTLCDIKCGEKAARSGSKGDLVKTLQQGLIDCGFALPNYGADGKYGNETSEAVKKLQTENKITVDGVIGPETIAVMIEKKCVKGVNCNCVGKKSFDDNISGSQGTTGTQGAGGEDTMKYDEDLFDDEGCIEDSEGNCIDETQLNCKRCPKAVVLSEINEFSIWCINNCNTKVTLEYTFDV
jgi:hypothetical protein